MRSQEEMIQHFLPLLRNEGGIYRKNVTSYVRKARRGERVVTELRGKEETRRTVNDDSSWVVCAARSDGERYVVSDRQFREGYDVDSGRAIIDDAAVPNAEQFREEGFLEYDSRRRIWACEVDEAGMRFVQEQGETEQGGKAPLAEYSQFVAPWDEPMRVELGDYLAATYRETDEERVEIYRIERAAFDATYIDCAPEAARPNAGGGGATGETVAGRKGGGPSLSSCVVC